MKLIAHTLLATLIMATLPIAYAVNGATSEIVPVTRIVDGDTFKVKLGKKTETIRIIGIDTPETKDPRKPVQCFGKEATAKLTTLIQKKIVTLEKNPAEDRDKYHRLLRYVTLNGEDIGATMIAEGYAFSYRKFPHPRLEEYNTLENTARGASKGLWSTYPASGGEKRTSGQQRGAERQGQSQSSVNTGNFSSTSQQCVIKGNISATGEKIYHFPGCGSYEKTVIDETSGERWFCSETEATTAGWRRARNCY